MRLSLVESVDDNFGAATAFSYIQVNIDDDDYDNNSSTANPVGGHLCVLAVGTVRGYLTLYVVDGNTRLSFTSNTGGDPEDSADDHTKPLAPLIEVDSVQMTDGDGGFDEESSAILEIVPCPRYREILLVRSRKRVSLNFRAPGVLMRCGPFYFIFHLLSLACNSGILCSDEVATSVAQGVWDC